MGPERTAAAERRRLGRCCNSMFTVVCRLDELADGEARGFDPEGTGRDAVFAVRRKGRVWIYRDACPHEGTPMPWRRHAYLNTARDRIVCHAHGAQFEIESGRCILGPCLGQSLQRVPHLIIANGEIRLLEELDVSPRSGTYS
jgi:nitrite reductase/ring-hydroxylating ferredoxin subunit